MTPVGAENWHSSHEAMANDGDNVSNYELFLALPPVVIDEFPFDGEAVRLTPPLEFPIVQSLHDDAWEVYGEAFYASVFVHAPNSVPPLMSYAPTFCHFYGGSMPWKTTLGCLKEAKN